MNSPYYFTWSAQNEVNPVSIEGAIGAEFIGAGGRHIWDAVSCSYQASFGHSYEKILSAIRMQLDDAVVLPPKIKTQQRERASNRLRDLLGFSGKGKIFYTVSGAESVENALKMAREIRGANQIVARAKSYHGASMGAMSVTGDWRSLGHFGVQDYTLRIPECDADPNAEQTRMIVEAFGPDKIAAFCLETITGGNGVYPPPKSWWNGIQKIAKDYGILLILDEVMCGFGRTGKHFGFHHYSIEPDFVCMAKAISAGYIPFGAVWTSDKIAKHYDANVLSCGLTSYAHPLGLAAMEAVITELEDSAFQSEMKQNLLAFTKELKNIAEHDEVEEVREIGLLAAVQLKNPERITTNAFLEAGVFLHMRDGFFVLAPPFIMNDANLRDLFSKVRKVLDGKA